MKTLCLVLCGLALAGAGRAQPALPPPPDSLRGQMQRPGTPASRLTMLLRVASAYGTHSDTARTLRYARAAAQLARQLHNPLALGEALMEQGNTYFVVGALPQAERLALQALPLTADHAQGVSAQRLLAQIYARQNRPAAALAAYRLAYRAAAARHDVLGQLNIDNGRGVLFSGNEQLDSADFYLVRAVRGFGQLASRLPEKRRAEAATLGSLASLNLKRKRYAEAARYARQSIALKLAIPDSGNLGPSFGVLYIAALAADSLPQALRYVRQNLRLSRRFHQRDGVQVCLLHLGNTFAKLGQPDSAEAYYRQAVALAGTGGQPVRRGSSLLALATFYDKQHRPAQALRTALEVEALDSLYRNPGTTLDNLRLLAHLAQTRHDDAAALGYFQRQRQLEMRHAAASSSQAMAALRVRFDTERTEQQLVLTTALAATETQRAVALHLLSQQQATAYHDTLNQREHQRLRQQLQGEQQAGRAERAGRQVLALTERNHVQTQQARLQQQALRLASQQQELTRLRTRQQQAGGAALLLLILAGASGMRWKYRRRQATREAALRTQLAADLHDDVGSLLTQIGMQSDLLRQPNATPAQTLARLDRLSAASRQAARQMADVVWGLQESSTSLPEVLVHMRDHAHEVLPPAGLLIDFGVSEAVGALMPPAAVCQHLYLIYKECLHNVVKHAKGATQVTVRLTYGEGQLCLSVQDNAPGPAVVGRAGGHGLANLQRRAEAVGGTVRVEARAEGFGVMACLPV